MLATSRTVAEAAQPAMQYALQVPEHTSNAPTSIAEFGNPVDRDCLG